MHESTAQNSHKPIEPATLKRPTDNFAAEMLRPLIAHEVARQLSAPRSAPTAWQSLTHALFVGSAVSLIIMAVYTVVGSLR